MSQQKDGYTPVGDPAFIPDLPSPVDPHPKSKTKVVVLKVKECKNPRCTTRYKHPVMTCSVCDNAYCNLCVDACGASEDCGVLVCSNCVYNDKHVCDTKDQKDENEPDEKEESKEGKEAKEDQEDEENENDSHYDDDVVEGEDPMDAMKFPCYGCHKDIPFTFDRCREEECHEGDTVCRYCIVHCEEKGCKAVFCDIRCKDIVECEVCLNRRCKKCVPKHKETCKEEPAEEAKEPEKKNKRKREIEGEEEAEPSEKKSRDSPTF